MRGGRREREGVGEGVGEEDSEREVEQMPASHKQE